MMFQKRRVEGVLAAVCFCMALLTLTVPAHAASVSCPNCGISIGGNMFPVIPSAIIFAIIAAGGFTKRPLALA